MLCRETESYLSLKLHSDPTVLWHRLTVYTFPTFFSLFSSLLLLLLILLFLLSLLHLLIILSSFFEQGALKLYANKRRMVHNGIPIRGYILDEPCSSLFFTFFCMKILFKIRSYICFLCPEMFDHCHVSIQHMCIRLTIKLIYLRKYKNIHNLTRLGNIF